MFSFCLQKINRMIDFITNKVLCQDTQNSRTLFGILSMVVIQANVNFTRRVICCFLAWTCWG